MADQGYPSIRPHLAEGRAPVVPQSDITGDAGTVAKEDMIPLMPKDPSAPPIFHMFRSVLTSPTYLRDVASNATAISGGRAIPLPPIDMAYLQRVAEGAQAENNDYAAYLNDTLPLRTASSLRAVNASVVIRNDGWNTIPAGMMYGLEVNATIVVSKAAWGLRTAACQTAVSRAVAATVLPVCGVHAVPGNSTGGGTGLSTTNVFPVPALILSGATGVIPVVVEVPQGTEAVAQAAAAAGA